MAREWQKLVSAEARVGAIPGSRRSGRPYCPAAAERPGTGRFVAAPVPEGPPVASPPEQMAAMTASTTCAAKRSFKGA
jgi:hypothetical protein